MGFRQPCEAMLFRESHQEVGKGGRFTSVLDYAPEEIQRKISISLIGHLEWKDHFSI
jgi:hypothetical protein